MQGSLDVVSEASYYRVYLFQQLSYANCYKKPNVAVCSFGISESFEGSFNILSHASCIFLGSEVEVLNFRLFITEEMVMTF